MIGFKVNWAFIKKVGPGQWHYVIWRMWAGFGAFIAGIRGKFGLHGYRADFYGPPNLATQIKCDTYYKALAYSSQYGKKIYDFHTRRFPGIPFVFKSSWSFY